MLKTLNKAVGGLNKACAFLLGMDMVAMLGILLLQIFSRFVAFMPLPWSQDLIVFMLVVAVFLGAGSATAAGKQIRLEVFVDILSAKPRNAILILADLIGIAFLAVVTRQAIALAAENMTVIVGASPVTFGWYYVAVVFGSVVMALNFLCIILDRVMILAGKKAGEEGAQ